MHTLTGPISHMGTYTCKGIYVFLLSSSLRLLLGSGLGLGGFLLVAPDHDHADEGADDGGAQEEEDDGDADCPDAGEEEVLEGVVVVDEGL